MLVTVEEPKVLTHTLVCCRFRNEVEKGKLTDENKRSNVGPFFFWEEENLFRFQPSIRQTRSFDPKI